MFTPPINRGVCEHPNLCRAGVMFTGCREDVNIAVKITKTCLIRCSGHGGFRPGNVLLWPLSIPGPPPQETAPPSSMSSAINCRVRLDPMFFAPAFEIRASFSIDPITGTKANTSSLLFDEPEPFPLALFRASAACILCRSEVLLRG